MRRPFGFVLLLAMIAGERPFSAVAQEPVRSAEPSSPVTGPVSIPPAADGGSGTGLIPRGSQPVQNENGIYTLQRTARIVVLDVVVTDRKGNVVTDLRKENFSVTEAKESQTVLNFEATGAHALDAAETINSTADLDRLAPRAPVNIILLDEFNTRFEDMAFARYSLKKFMEKQPDKLSTPTMLLAVNLQRFTVVHDYTQDKAAILDALDHHLIALPWQSHQSAWVAERFGTAFLTLRRVAEATVGHPGHKNMIWIGRGFPAMDFSQLHVDGAARVDNAVQECVNSLRDARVTLYSVDPEGLQVNPDRYGPVAAFNDPFGGNYQFNKLAAATGGKAMYGRNDVDAEIGTSIRDGTSFYTLTYRPTTGSLDPQKFRKIQVTLSRPDLVATTREGYYVERRPERVNPSSPSRRLAMDLVSAESSTMVYDGVPITVTPVASTPNSYIIHIEPQGLSWSYVTDVDPTRHADVIVMATTFDKKGKELKRHATSMHISAPAGSPPTGRLERGADLPVKLEPDQKAVRARIVVRVTASGRIGTADVVVPGS